MATPAGSAIEGTIVDIRFHNPESFWTVATLRPGSDGVARLGAEPVTVVGTLPGLCEGMAVRMDGRWDENARFGRQFKAERFVELVPATKEGLEAYLASGFVKGIGEKLAQRIVDKFGEATIDVIVNAAERLSEVNGLGEKRAQALVEAFRERRGTQDALVFLLGLGIPRGLALRILRRYGERTVSAVRENPYRLASEVHGIGFIKADQVARGMQIAGDHPERVRAGVVHVLREARGEGHVCLPHGFLLERARTLLGVGQEAVDTALASLIAERRLVREERLELAGAAASRPSREGDDAVYLAPLFDDEVGVATAIAALARGNDAGAAPEAAAGEVLARIDAAAEALQIQLAPGQRRAVELALGATVAVVTGGPGTGKTTIIRTLIEASTLPRHRIALAAPTGRAAKRMAEATGRQAQTIHRLLEFNPVEGDFVRNEELPLDADLIIVDEASMIDISLCHALVRAVPAGARLVLVGDVEQLPPVGPGSPLGDLIRSEVIPVARLTEVYRQGAGSLIVDAAHAIHAGRALPPTPGGGAGSAILSDFYFVPREEPEQIRATIESLVCERIGERFGLDRLRDVQVLSPMRSGPLGVDALNERLQQLLNPAPGGPESGVLVLDGEAPRKETFRVGDKVMQIRNDYERGVFNGDVGFVHAVEAKGVLHVAMDERLVSYDRDAQEDLVLAYAVTVHKSQGSEYPAVVMPLSTHHYKMLRRNLLYTAITRGKRLVVLVGSERAMRIAVSNATVEVRESGLCEKLRLAMRA